MHDYWGLYLGEGIVLILLGLAAIIFRRGNPLPKRLMITGEKRAAVPGIPRKA
jgi:hypothetical protein